MQLPDWNDSDLQAAAPVLEEWIALYNLPRSVVYGLVSQESRFVATAYRAEPQINDASYGLTQILLGTAQGLGYSGDGNGLFDPDTSAQFGLLYFRNLLDRYGDVGQALSAYNTGHATGSTKGATYASQVLTRAAYFDALIGAAPDSTDTATLDTIDTGGSSTAPAIAAAVGVILLAVTVAAARGKL